MVKEIPLQNGMVALVDDEDYERISEHIWTLVIGETTMKVVSNGVNLKHFLLNIDNDELIICKNKNNLDFRKVNLLKTNTKTMSFSRKGNRESTSKYRGVHWNKRSEKWIAKIKLDGVIKYLGCFLNEDDAAKAYNKASYECFGEYGYQNIIGENNNAKTVVVNAENKVQIRQKNSSGYKGVAKHGNKFKAYITIKRKTKYLGLYPLIEQAAKVYDREAYELFGDKAILNFPDEYRNMVIK